MTSRIRSCFITAPAGSNLDVLTHALRDRDIRIVVPQGLPVGAELGTEISSLVAGVDLVIGVLTRERRSEWVLFELGLAWARGKRILLFAPPNNVHLPSTLRGLLTVRANLSNREAIEFALDQLLAAPELSPRPASLRETVRPLGPSARDYLQRSADGADAVPEADLERLVSDALGEAGVGAIVTSRERDQGADLAIWSDNLQTSVGNPLLIEIRARSPGSKTSDAARELSAYVSASGSRWGLLLYGEGPEEQRGLPANVLALSVSRLFHRLQDETFDDVIRDLRNRRVHGGTA